MYKRIFLFFVLLTTIVGSVWADEVTFGYADGSVSLSGISVSNSGTQPITSGNITLTFTSTSEKTVSQNDSQLKFQTGTSFTVSGNGVLLTQVVITHSETSRSFTCSDVSNYSWTNGSSTGTWAGSSTSDITFTNGYSNNLNVTSIVVTYETIDENTYTAPKTWTFNKGGESWTDISGSDLTDNRLWVSQTDNGNVYYVYNGTASGDVPLYYKNGVKLIPEAQGLLFNANGTASNITTDLKYDITIMNGASVIIPNAKAGQLITLFGWYGSSSLTMSNNVTQESSDVPTDGGAGTIKIRVDSDGDVRLSHSYLLHIWSISIYGDLTRFSSMGGQTYVHEAGAAAFNHTIIVEPTDALPANMDSNTLKNYITVTSSNSDAFNVDNITLSYNQAKGRLIIYGIKPGTTNGQEATLNIRYHDRPYNATEITTRTFYIRQAATVSFPESSITVDYNATNPEYQTATSSYGGTIKYKTSSSIIDVNETTGVITDIHGTGAAVITAYTEQTDAYAYAEAFYTVNVTTEGDVSFYFLKDETKVNIGQAAYLELSMPGVLENNIHELYYIIKDPDGVDHKVVAFGGQTSSDDEFSDNVLAEVQKNADEQIVRATIRISAENNEESIGKSLIVTAFLNYNYTDAVTQQIVEHALVSSTTKLTFTGAASKNWEIVRNGGYMFVGDAIGVPGITGNPNANEGVEYALAKNTSAQYLKNGVGETKTVYRPKSNTVTYTLLKADNNEPEDLVTLFHCQNLEKLGNDSLLVYARAAGSVKIRLTDNTTGSYSDYTLLIKTRDDVVTRSARQIEYFPYTWDFSQGVSTDSKNLLASDENYWSRYDHPNNKTIRPLDEGVYTTNMGFARRDISKSNGNLSNKNFTANDQLLIEFRGIQCQIGATDISSTFGRLTIDTNAAVGEPFLHIVGSSKLYLTELNNADKCVNGDYMIYVKAKKGGQGIIECAGTTKYLSGNDPEVLGFEVTQGTQDVMIDANGCYIYWIAATTEARNISTASGTDGSEANQHLATYSYDADFDLDKVYEAEKVDAWYVTAVGASKAEGSNKKQLGVTLSKAPSEIRANTGVILRQTDNTSNTSTSAYMIAKAKNLSDSYTPPAALSSNMLKPTGMNGTTIYAEAGDADGLTQGNQYLTYIMTSKYVWGKDPDTEINYEGYGFFKLWEESYTTNPQMSYLVFDKSVFDDVQLGGGVDPTDGGAVKLYLVFDGEDEWTGIEEIRSNNSNASTGDDAYYTLQGTRVAQPTKGGVYIHQGKKIFVK